MALSIRSQQRLERDNSFRHRVNLNANRRRGILEDQLTFDEEQQLRLIACGLRTNEKQRYERAIVESLIKKGVIAMSGIAIRLTLKGEEALRKL